MYHLVYKVCVIKWYIIVKRITNSDVFMKTMILKITDEQMKKLDEHKERTKVSKSGIVRIAIDQYLGGVFT